MKIKNVLTPPGTEHKSPSWLKWVLVLFVVYALGQSYFQPQEKAALRGVELTGGPSSVPVTELSEMEAKNLQITENFQNFKHKLFPEGGAELAAREMKIGEGAAAQCGQSVKLRYESALADGKKVESSREVSFRLGDPSAMPALAQGVSTMRVGGERSVFAPYEVSYGAPGQVNQNIPKNAQIQFTLTLLDVSPALGKNTLSLKWFEETRGNGDTIVCGEKAKIMLTLWRLDGTQFFRTEKPLEIMLGSGIAPLGLEQGIIGMRPGAKRTIILPPEYQKKITELTKASPASPPAFPAIAFPAHETVLAEVERAEAE